MKELKVGSRFSVTLEVVEQNGCEGCFFEGDCYAYLFDFVCIPDFRSDGKKVIFKEVKSKAYEQKINEFG